jgi:bla regulator protein BlaR1
MEAHVPVRVIVSAAMLFVLRCGLSCGQTPRFEVVSIRPSPSMDVQKSMSGVPGGGFKCTNYSLRHLIQLGWDVRGFQISGDSRSLDRDRYNIETRTAAPINVSEPDGQRQFRQMVQAMLADRFRLKVHQQKKDMKVFFLTVGRSGDRLKRVGDATDRETSMRDGKGWWTAKKIDMSMMASNLGGELGVPVIDKTGLSGAYDINLQWNPDDDGSGPSIFTALQEQLGLKLESGRAPVPVLVVDHAERASAN